MKQCLSRLLLIMLLVAVASSIGYAQGTTAALTGTVLDQSGGAIPGADVKVRNDATGAEYDVITNDRGIFSVPGLTPGSYTATISMTNFKTKVYKAIRIDPQSPASLIVTLEVGGKDRGNHGEGEHGDGAVAVGEYRDDAEHQPDHPIAFGNAQPAGLPDHDAGSEHRSSGARYPDINGMSASSQGQAINITIDGINTMDNYRRIRRVFSASLWRAPTRSRK